MTMPPLALSVIDAGDPAAVPHLVRSIDRFGYKRFWTTEHRGPCQSASPAIVAAIAASHSTRLRVGTAGVKLRYASPRRIAEDFLVLERTFPGRCDLGVITARESAAAMHDQLLDGRADASADPRRKFRELVDLLSGIAKGVPIPQELLPHPRSAGLQLWQCGLSSETASDAAARGVGFAFHDYIARGTGISECHSILAMYRDRFCPSASLPTPLAAVACFGACARTRREAEAHWRNQMRLPNEAAITTGAIVPRGATPQPTFLGTPSECYDQLSRVAGEYGVTELVLECFGSTLESRVQQYELLAQAFSLE